MRPNSPTPPIPPPATGPDTVFPCPPGGRDAVSSKIDSASSLMPQFLVFPLIQSLPELSWSEPYFHSESERKDAVNRPLFGSVSAHRSFRSSRRRSGHVRRSTYGCPSLSLYFVDQRFVGGAWQIVPPPTTTSPSYRTTACPTVTALCGTSNSSLTRPCCSGYTAAHCSA